MASALFQLMIPSQPQERDEALTRVLTEYLGGDDTVRLLTEHHVDGWSERELAERSGASRQAVHKRIVMARVRLRRVGLMPQQWEREPAHRHA